MGELNINSESQKNGVIYKGKFYPFGSQEYNALMHIEGKKEENKDTLLGLISQITRDENHSN